MTMIATFVTYTLYSQLREATGPLDVGISTLGGEDGSFRDRVASVVARLKDVALLEGDGTVEARTSWAGEPPTAAPTTVDDVKGAVDHKTAKGKSSSVQIKDEEKPRSKDESKKDTPKKDTPKKDAPKKDTPKKDTPKKTSKKDTPKTSKKEDEDKDGSKDIHAVTSKKIDSFAIVHQSVLQPVKGHLATNGSKPLWNMKHKGTDAIMALACKYPVQFYKRFVGSLRKAGYSEDIVLAVSPVNQMKPGVETYLKDQQVVSYAFEVDCAGPDNCKLRDEFLGYAIHTYIRCLLCLICLIIMTHVCTLHLHVLYVYLSYVSYPDPREHRTFANIRYALYGENHYPPPCIPFLMFAQS